MTIHAPEARPDLQRLTLEAAREHVLLVRTNPAFAEASVRTINLFATSMIGGGQLNLLMSDRGRIFYLLGALHLHANPDERGSGLTVGRLIALGRAHAMGSRGRVIAFIGALRWTGFVKPQTDPGSAGVLVPTERFLSTIRQRWAAQMENLAMMLPHGAAARDRLASDPDFVLEIGAHMFTIFAAGYRAFDYAPHLLTLADQKGAMVILLNLYFARSASAESPSLASIARDLAISRAHARKVLRLATQIGLLERGADGERLLVTSLLTEEAEGLTAGILAFFSLAAELALASKSARYFGNSIPISR